MKKALQTAVSLSIFIGAWILFKLPFFDMAFITKCVAIPAVFWVIWAIEAVFMSWWLGSELKLQYLSVNPFVWVGWLYLIAALVLYLCNLRVIALIMVGIGAIPLAIMAAFLLVILLVSIFNGPIRWN